MTGNSEAPVERLKRIRARVEKLLEKRDVSIGQIKITIGQVRATLRTIYGESYDIDSSWRLEDVSEDGDRVEELERRLGLLTGIIEHFDNLAPSLHKPNKVFIGHGRSLLWRELKDFISERLGLPWDEFNREPVAGKTTQERIQEMQASAVFAFLIMTAEEEAADASLHARPNVIHEIGLFQGTLGPHKAIVLLEEGCEEFSNIAGLSQIRFPPGNVEAVFEQVRATLEREGII